jgi:membrane protease YdiL (CAAX protease family)
MAPIETSSASGPIAPLWLLIVAAACLPVTIVALVRIHRWWLSGDPLPLPADGALGCAWPPVAGLALFVLMTLAMMLIAAGYAEGKKAGLWPWEPLNVPEMFSPGMFLAQVVPALAGLGVLRLFGRGAAATAGVRVGNARVTLLAGLVAFAAVLPVCVVALKVNVMVNSLLGIAPQVHPLLQTVQRAPEAWVLPLALLQAAVLAALAEEFIYRGVLMMSLLRHAGPAAALAISSVAFALVHLRTEPQAVLPLFLLALAMGWVGYWTRSLLAPVITHALFNALMVVSTFTGQ